MLMKFDRFIFVIIDHFYSKFMIEAYHFLSYIAQKVNGYSIPVW